MELDFDVRQFSFDRFEGSDPINFSLVPSNSLSTSCESSASDNEVKVRHRKTKTRRIASLIPQQFRLPSPQVVKSDVRRKFATMFAHVHNSCDYDTMMNHICSFYDREVTVQQRDLRFGTFLVTSSFSRIHILHHVSCASSVASSGLNTLNMSGPQYKGHAVLSEYWYRSMFIAPDQISKLRHACLTMRSDDSAKLKFCFSKIGNKVISALSDSEYKRINSFLKEKSGDKKTINFGAASMSDASQRKRPYSDLIPSWVLGNVSPNDAFEDVDEERRTDTSNVSTGSDESMWKPQTKVAPILYEELTDFESVQAVQNYLIATRALERRRAQLQQQQQQHRRQSGHLPVVRENSKKTKRPPPRDWMSLACDAVLSGIIECRSQDEADEDPYAPRIAPTMDRSRLTDQPLPCPGADLVYVPSPADKNVLTAAFDCTISVELEFSAECKVVSMVVDLIT